MTELVSKKSIKSIKSDESNRLIGELCTSRAGSSIFQSLLENQESSLEIQDSTFGLV